MRRLVLFGTLAVLLAIAGSGNSSPIKGKHAASDQRIGGKSRLALKMEFRGGERACVIVQGSHNPVVDLVVTVLDATGKVVAKDDGGGDFVAAIWYPPRTAVYGIQILNAGEEDSTCYISLK
jgi:hypothetical protein